MSSLTASVALDAPSSTFAELGVPAEAVTALRLRGIDAPFPIQALAIPAALSGRDICGRAPTGSGKTIAFGIPLAMLGRRARPGRPTALVLAPTRELAAQIEAEMRLLVGHRRQRYVAAFYGGVGFGPQLNALRHGVDVAVACPGRLRDLMGRRAISLADVSIVVVDEADRMADMGFLPDVKAILDEVRADRQTMLFSATLDGEVEALVKRYQREPLYVSVETEEQPSTATHEWVEVPREGRVALAARYAGRHGPTVVFCRTKHGVDRVARQLVAAGVKAVPLHGGRTQAQREQALRAFSSGRAQALVATDVAARGIHVDGVGCVVHFDLPGGAKDYLHRSGRTGRAGAGGLVVSFVTPEDASPVRRLKKAIGQLGHVGKAGQTGQVGRVDQPGQTRPRRPLAEGGERRRRPQSGARKLPARPRQPQSGNRRLASKTAHRWHPGKRDGRLVDTSV